MRERDALAPLAARDGEPEFAEHWQAQALGIAFSLVEAGAFTRAQWSQALGAALVDARRMQAPDDQETYYRCVVTALETLLAASGAVPAAALAERVERWRAAYLETPHGQPVALRVEP